MNALWMDISWQRVVTSALVIAGGTLVYLAISKWMQPWCTSHKDGANDWRVIPGRRAAVGHKNMAVFLIGMRVNKWYRIDLWLPCVFAMHRMLRELQANREMFGFYGGVTYGLLGLVVGYPSLQVMYWENTEKVIEYATGIKHKTAMVDYVNILKRSGACVGVWHELYDVQSGEGIFRNMPLFGLSEAVGSVPCTGCMETSRERLSKWGSLSSQKS